MIPIFYRDLVVNSVRCPETGLLDMIIAQLAEAEKAKQILCAKGYGASDTPLSALAAMAPAARVADQ